MVGTLPAMDQQLATIRDASDSGWALVHVDTCLGSFLNDHHNRDGEFLIGVYVDGTTTFREIFEGIEDEMSATTDGSLPGWDFDKALAAIHAERSAYITDGRLDETFDSSLDVPGEDDDDIAADEMCQAWFVLTWNVEDAD